MTERTPVHVTARDPISRAGIVAQLRPRPEVTVVDTVEEATVALVVADGVDEETVQLLRRLQRGGARAVLVAQELDEQGLAAAVEAGMAGVGAAG